MSKAEITTHVVVNPITAEDLAFAGVKRVTKSAGKRLEELGITMPDGASPEFMACAMSVHDNLRTEKESGRRAAIALALMEESGEWKRMTDPNGKGFKNFSTALKAIFPMYAEGTIRAYMGAGRSIYLPAARGKLDQRLLPLNDVGPGTAMFISGVLNDKDVAPRVPAALEKAMNGATSLNQKMVREAVAIAKNPIKAEMPAANANAGDSAKTTDEQEFASSAPRKSAAEVHNDEITATKLNIKRYWKPEVVDGSLTFTITPDNMAAFARVVKIYAGDGAAARTFFEAMHSLIHPAPKANSDN